MKREIHKENKNGRQKGRGRDSKREKEIFLYDIGVFF